MKSERSQLLTVSSQEDTREAPSVSYWKQDHDHEWKEALVVNGSRLVLILTSVAVLAALVSSSSNGTAGNLTATTIRSMEPDSAAWDETVDLWETSLANRHREGQYATMELGTVELLGKSRKSKDAADSSSSSDGELIYLNHTKAFDMLKTHSKSSSALDFYYYQQGWEAQINQAYCGVATSAALLNSLRGQLQLPQDPVYNPFPWATQKQLIRNECVRDTLYDVDKMHHVFFGIGLDMAVQLLNCNLDQGYEATAYHVDPQKMSEKEVRAAIRGALEDTHARVAINYDRGGIGQGDMGHGHFSPIAAYNHETDSFLVMDVAKYKHPPVWVSTSRLMGGIGGVDNCASFVYPDSPPDFATTSFEDLAKTIGCEPAFRGFLIVNKTD